MTFASELQGWSSHKALLAVQDFEICLLETIKKCLAQRIKSDRDYANALAAIVAMAQKQDLFEHNTPFCQVWLGIIKEMENVIQVMNENIDKLNAQTVETFSRILNNKKTVRKLYSEQRNRLELELYRLQEEVTKNRAEYEARLNKLVESRAKYEELLNRGGRTSTRLDEVKAKYVKSEIKVHNIHNVYVISLCELNVYQQSYLSVTLPALLDLQQKLQEVFARQCHDVLLEYVRLTDLSGDRYQNIYRSTYALMAFMSSLPEYSSFVEKFKSDPAKCTKQEFSPNLLNGSCRSIYNTNIIVNDWTSEAIQQSKVLYMDQLNRCRQVIGNRRQALREMEEDRSNANNFTSVSSIKRELFEQQCLEEKYRALLNIVTVSLDQSSGFSQEQSQEPVNLDTSSGASLQTENGVSSSRPTSSAYVSASASGSTSGSTSGSSASASAKQTLSNLKTAFTKKMAFANSSLRVPKKSSRFQDYTSDFHSGKQNDTNVETASVASCDSATVVEPSSRGLVVETRSLDDSRASGMVSAASQEVLRLSASNDNLADIPERYQQVEMKEEGALEEEQWFHGVLPREEVHRLLVTDGDYLVRMTYNRAAAEKQYVLSVMWSTHKHFIIQKAPPPQNGWHFEGEAFPTIQQLLKHHQITGERVTRKSAAILKTAVARPEWQLYNDDVSLEAQIGSGQFGEVFRGKLKSKGIRVAVKTCRDSVSEEMKKKFLQEAHILQQYNHPNIVRFIGVAAQRHPVMIVMEYISGGSLLTYLRKRGAQMAAKTLVRMCKDAAAGMKYLEQKQCLHRDLAARNCLVDENEVVKISDFGMSREQQQYVVSAAHTQIPIKWTAPEALTYGIYTSASDVWSFGILIWEVFALGAMPYPGLTNSQARDKVDQGYRMPPPEDAPDTIYSLMLQCWQHEPTDRPKFNSVYKQLNQIHSSLS